MLYNQTDNKYLRELFVINIRRIFGNSDTFIDFLEAEKFLFEFKNTV